MQAYRNLEETERPNKLRCISQALPIQDQVVLQEIGSLLQLTSTSQTVDSSSSSLLGIPPQSIEQQTDCYLNSNNCDGVNPTVTTTTTTSVDLPDDSKLAQIPCQDIPGINFDDLISPVDNFFEFFSNSNSYEQPLPEQDIALWNSTLQDFVVREDL